GQVFTTSRLFLGCLTVLLQALWCGAHPVSFNSMVLAVGTSHCLRWGNCGRVTPWVYFPDRRADLFLSLEMEASQALEKAKAAIGGMTLETTMERGAAERCVEVARTATGIVAAAKESYLVAARAQGLEDDRALLDAVG
ncbi:unnamed protein product, partial [Ectocarpus fasciculatus]